VVRTSANEKVTYLLTERGEDAVFILLAFLRYGIRHHAAAADTESNASGSRESNPPNRRAQA
ncbi:MAG TPA: hypothetical protein VJP06_01320, partial [Thermoplasmata archaeon]|nr:hypothetical protein [Thermoplasmata archaeon]